MNINHYIGSSIITRMQKHLGLFQNLEYELNLGVDLRNGI